MDEDEDEEYMQGMRGMHPMLMDEVRAWGVGARGGGAAGWAGAVAKAPTSRARPASLADCTAPQSLPSLSRNRGPRPQGESSEEGDSDEDEDEDEDEDDEDSEDDSEEKGLAGWATAGRRKPEVTIEEITEEDDKKVGGGVGGGGGTWRAARVGGVRSHWLAAGAASVGSAPLSPVARAPRAPSPRRTGWWLLASSSSSSSSSSKRSSSSSRPRRSQSLRRRRTRRTTVGRGPGRAGRGE
jgi:hypothetical protein